MAWSIFSTSTGGGKPAAEQWAIDFLTALGVPVTPGNAQFAYDWEVSEGGGGKNNPLNQGPVTGHPELTTTGSQYGGGASDFASYAAGIVGAVDYLNYSNYAGVLKGLQNNDPAAAKAALIASPWAAGHYGGGSGFSDAALPSSTLPTAGTTAPASTGDTSTATSGSSASLLGLSIPTPSSIATSVVGLLVDSIKQPALVAILLLGAAGLALLSAAELTKGPRAKVKDAAEKAAPLAMMAA